MKTYRDIVGDGGSRIGEQVAEQRARIERALSGVHRIVAVGSGKGGVGKSTLTLHLAATLAARGDRVAVLDADLNGPTQAQLAGLAKVPLVPGTRGLQLPRTAEGLGVVSLGQALGTAEPLDFETLGEGGQHVWRGAREFALLGDLVAGVEWGEQDLLLADLPPGAERARQYAEFLGPNAAFVLVTIPSAVARGVVARSVSALRNTPNPLLGYIENMKGYDCPGCGEIRPLFPESDLGLDLPCLGSVPFDPLLAAACDRGVSVLSERSRGTAKALDETAERLRRALEAIGRGAR